jgi:hypothetical protein
MEEVDLEGSCDVVDAIAVVRIRHGTGQVSEDAELASQRFELRAADLVELREPSRRTRRGGCGPGGSRSLDSDGPFAGDGLAHQLRARIWRAGVERSHMAVPQRRGRMMARPAVLTMTISRLVEMKIGDPALRRGRRGA